MDSTNPNVLDLSIVIINWRMAHHLGPCLKSLYERPHQLRFEVILVNKPSEDGAEKFTGIYPQLILAPFERFGISVMRNEGIRLSHGRYVLILDADTEVESGALDRLVSFMNTHPRVGVAGGKTFRPDGTLEYSCKRFYTLMTILFRRTPLGKWFPENRWERHHLMLDEDHENELECDWVAGACYLMRREAFMEVGVFDDSFYFGFEDVDYCYRVKKAGWKVMYIPQAVIIHHVQRKSAGYNRLSWEHLKSGFRFWWKHYIRKSATAKRKK